MPRQGRAVGKTPSYCVIYSLVKYFHFPELKIYRNW